MLLFMKLPKLKSKAGILYTAPYYMIPDGDSIVNTPEGTGMSNHFLPVTLPEEFTATNIRIQAGNKPETITKIPLPGRKSIVFFCLVCLHLQCLICLHLPLLPGRVATGASPYYSMDNEGRLLTIT